MEVNEHPVFGLEPEQIIKILVRGFEFILSFLWSVPASKTCPDQLRLFPNRLTRMELLGLKLSRLLTDLSTTSPWSVLSFFLSFCTI